MKLLFSLVFILLQAMVLLAQEQDKPQFLGEVQGSGGRAFFDPARPMAGFEPYRSASIRIGKYSNGVQQWARDLNNPYYGLGLHINRYGDKDIYGTPHAAYVFVGIPLRKLNKWNVVFDGAAGLAWGFIPNHPEENPENNEISSKVNVYFNVNAQFEYPMTEKWMFTTGVGITHFSNSITRFPNIGVNLLHGNVGVRRNFGFKPKGFYKPELGKGLDDIDPIHRPFWGIYVALNGGVKQILAQGEIYNIRSTYAEAFYRYSRIGRVTFGADYFHDPSRNDIGWERPTGPGAPHRIGIHAGHDFIINRTYLTTQVGLFVHEGYNTDEYFFFRFGGKFRITDHLYINTTLMSFWVYAKMIEVGVGFNLY